MKVPRILTAVVLVACAATVALADAVLPPAYANQNGTTGLNTPVRNYGRTYRFTVPGADLVGAGGD